jgi:hypothetical protein
MIFAPWFDWTSTRIGEKATGVLNLGRLSLRSKEHPRMRRVSTSALIVVALSTPTLAADYVKGPTTFFTSSDDLSKQCSSSSASDRGYCLGYAAGIADWLNNPDRDVCLPSWVTLGQIKQIAIDAAQVGYPKPGRGPASLLVAGALMQAFPCPK